MKIGKVPENVLKRSILKFITVKRPEVLQGAGVGIDTSVISLEKDEVFVTATNPVMADCGKNGLLSVERITNELASSGAKPIGITACALFPPNTEEEDIKFVFSELKAKCAERGLEITEAQSNISEAVNRPVLTVTGVGKALKGKTLSAKGAKPSDDVILTKWIGLSGTTVLAEKYEEKLLSKFPSKMVYDAKNMDKFLSVIPEAATALKSGVTATHNVTEGGIFKALWELAECSGVGLEIDLKKIPVKQETIEICNYFDINPYEMMSDGCLLITAKDGNRLVMDLKNEGIEASVIGKVTAGNDRVIVNGEGRRFLEPGKSDEIYSVIAD